MYRSGQSGGHNEVPLESMKHVWILNHYSQEPNAPGGTRHYSLARNLVDHGWRATIVAASTDHGTGQQRLSRGEEFRFETKGGVDFLWLRTRQYRGNGRQRVGNMIDYTLSSLRRKNLAMLGRPDAIIGSSVHPFAAWAGRRLARRFGVPFLFEVRDLWPQTLIDMGRLSERNLTTIGLRWLERSLYRSASKIIVLLPRASDYIEPLGIPAEKIVWIPNGVDVSQFRAQPGNHSPDHFTLMYFGAHGAANGLDNLLRAMKIVESRAPAANIVLRLIGDGPLKPALLEMSRELGLRNVRFEDQVAKADIQAVAAEADAFVICVRDMPRLYRYGISMNKIFDYLAAGRPTIIASDAVNNPIAEAGAGITVPPENSAAFAAAILQMVALSAERRCEMGRAARRHLENNYDMSDLAARLARTLDEALER